MKNSEAKKYNNIKLTIGITKAFISFLLLLLFIWFVYSLQLEDLIRVYISNDYLVLLSFIFVIGAVSSILFFPVNYYLEFHLEHKYNLSNQSFSNWILEDLKETLVGSAIGIPILLLFYFILIRTGNLWWLPFGALMFFVSVVLARIVPIFIVPLFYKVTPLDDEELKDRILNLSKTAGLKVENVFKFDMSKNTKKANAAFTGIGKSKRILLGDTLLENYTHDEIETVIAHELGHYEKKHILKNIIIGTVVSFLMFFLISFFYSISINWFGFSSIKQISALPLLLLWGSIIGLVLTPLTNIISRKFEYEADEYAVKRTNKKEAFINTLEKLTDQNLGDREPHKFIEWFFYSHPSIKRRITAINSL